MSQLKKSKSSYRNKSTSETISFYLDSAQYLSGRAPFRAIDKVNKAIELSLVEDDKNNEALSYWILGNIQQNMQQHELAVDNYKKSIAAASGSMPARNSKMAAESAPAMASKSSVRSNEISSSTLFHAYKHIAQSLSAIKRLDEAENFISKCLSGNFNGISGRDKLDAQRVQADILSKKGKVNEASQLLLSVLEQEKNQSDRKGEIKTLMALGTLQQQLKNPTRALEYFSQARTIAETVKEPELLLQINNSSAKVFREQKQPEKEREVRSDNIALSQSADKFETAEEQNMEIGKAYANSNQMEKALPFFEKSLEKKEVLKIAEPPQLFDKSADLESTADIYKLLAKEYLKRGDTQKSLAYLKSFIQLQDSIKSIRKRELDAALKLSNEIGKNQQRIDLLEKERMLSERAIQILKQDKQLREDELFTRNIIIGSLCFLLLFMFVGVYYILKSSREKRRANQLLAIKSLQGQMNPHFIFNALNSVNHYISQNDERAANKYLSDFSKLMRSVMDTSKHDLIFLSEELEILRLYLQLEHSRFREKFDYLFKIEESVEGSDFKLPPMIIQPFIENAIWHGLRYIEGKGQLNIHFATDEEGLFVTITDNGIGRKRSLEIKTRNQKMQNSTGMENIDNRIRIMNDLFKTNIRAEVSDAFPDAADPGTKVKLFIPKNINQHA